MSPEISPSTCLAAAFVRLVNNGEIHNFFFFCYRKQTETTIKGQGVFNVSLLPCKELVLKELC